MTARAYEDQEQWEAALADFDHYLAQVPDDARAYHHRGRVQQDLGNLDATIADYTQVLVLSPEHAGAHYDRAQAYAAQGDTQRAIQDYQRVIQSGDNSDLIQRAETALQELGVE